MMHTYQNVFFLASCLDRLPKFSDLRRWHSIVWILFLSLIVMCPACAPEKHPTPRPRPAMERVEPDAYPFFSDDMPFDALLQSMGKSLQYLKRLDPNKQFIFGNDSFTTAHMIESIETFSHLIQSPISPESLTEAIKESYWVYKSIGRDGQGEILFTGYYEPHLKGALQPTPTYSFPLYRRPADWVSIELFKFPHKYDTRRQVGRLTGQKVVPYFSREEIDRKGVLKKKGYELVWLSDPVELFFLHIQGSGRIQLQDGGELFVNYDCNNGHPYRSIGRLLIDDGKIDREEMSLQKIRSYLKSNPQDMGRVLNYNESYVFFRIVEKGPLGALEVPLTPGRSMATDLSIFPRGAIAFIMTEKPEVNDSGAIDTWKSFGRFMMNQDTGGAIRGPGRVDFFWGHGAYAEIAAGHMKQKGALYFLIKKK